MAEEFRTALAGAVIATALVGALGWCAARSPRGIPHNVTQREQSLHRVPVHIAEFATFAEPLAVPPCANTRPPEALATPDPLLQGRGLRVRVSFIVGADGRVHSPFVLESGGPEGDRLVLRAVRRWRYRPALCNGVPSEMEARVWFTSQ